MQENSIQKEQSRLLLKIVPFLYKISCFGFLGGTVINFFCTNTFKRYSVDLDGVYIPDKGMKDLSKGKITPLVNEKLRDFKKELLSPFNKKSLGILKVTHFEAQRKLKIVVQNPFDKNKTLDVKLEVHGTYIGNIEDLVVRRLGKVIREEFKIDCAIRSLGDSELYGSKIVALFARNTLKDSFDVYHLLKERDDITLYKKGTLFNFLGSTKSITRILNFNPSEVPKDYNEQYQNLGNSDGSMSICVEISRDYRKRTG